MWSAQKGRAQPWAILVMLSVVTALVSALLDNVTTVLLIAPVTLDIARHLETPPYPFLFAEVFASNIGGTATLIGDPPNIIIGSAAQLSFNDFAVNLTPAIIAVMAAQLVATHLIWGRKMSASAEARARIMALDRDQLIVDPKLMRSSLFVIGGVIAAFVFAGQLRLQPGTIALFGAAILMLLHNSNITGRATSRRSESPRHSTRSIGSRSSFSSGCSSSSTASMSPACSTWPHSA